jgi:CBS domain-containing protein
MALAVISNRPPVNALTGRIRILKTDQGKKINIKRSGIQPITEFARILCLQAGFADSSNTFDRLDYLKQTQPQIQSSVSEALDSYSHLNDIRLGHQLQAVSTGWQPDNLIDLNELSETQYQMLKASFNSIKSIQATLAHRFNLM